VWVYPEASLFRIGGEAAVLRLHVASIGSYIARVWRLFDLRFTHHPPLWAVVLVGIAIYVNFFAHHFIVDIRYGLFAVMALMFGRTMIYFKI